jgi:hypothetical protein
MDRARSNEIRPKGIGTLLLKNEHLKSGREQILEDTASSLRQAMALPRYFCVISDVPQCATQQEEMRHSLDRGVSHRP